MKRVILIILIVITLLLIGFWVYVMLNGAPQSADDLFADLGFGDSTEPAPFEPVPEPEPEPVVPPAPPENLDLSEPLTKLTDRPVAGSIIIGTSTANQLVRYVEQGTGHVYEIDLASGEETRIISTTRPQINEAYFNMSGDVVVLKVADSFNPSTVLVSITADSEQALPPDASNIGFSSDSTLNYTRSDDDGTLGYSYDITTDTAEVLFSVPFIAISTIWQEPPVIYNKPSEQYPGFVYEVVDNQLTAVTTGGDGLTAASTEDTLVVNLHNGRDYFGNVVAENGSQIPLPIPALPEKCARGASFADLWCAYPLDPPRNTAIPTDWYKGLVTFSDGLWLLDLDNYFATYEADLALGAVTLDVAAMSADTTGTRLLLTDKVTNTLWLYDTALD